MGNFSRNPQTELTGALDRDYVRVRFQQGKPALDRELNLAADLHDPQRMASRYVGNGIAGTGSDFQISGLNVGGNNFNIAAGRALVNGLEVVLRAGTTYQTQPVRTNVNPLPAGQSNIYLRALTREVGGSEDAGLLNAGDVGFETSVRDKVEWEVLVSAATIDQPDHLLLAVITTLPTLVIDRRLTGLNTAGLQRRMSVAHDATGALLANSVSNAAIANQAVTEPKLATGAVSKRALANGSASLDKLSSGVVLDSQLTVAANTDLVVNLQEADEHAFFLVSVHFDAPRPVVSAALGLTRTFTWSRRTSLIKFPFSAPTAHRHFHQITISNPNAFDITVSCKAYRLTET